MRHREAGLLDGLLEMLYIGRRAYRNGLARQIDVAKEQGLTLDYGPSRKSGEAPDAREGCRQQSRI